MAKTLDELNALVSTLEAKVDKAATTPAIDASLALPNHPPAIRKGESALTSRPFRFLNFLGLVSGKVSPDRAKVEKSMMDAFRKQIQDSRTGILGMADDSYAYPIGYSHLPDELIHSEVGKQFKSMISAGASDVDNDEVMHIASKIGRYRNDPEVVKAALTPAQSYLDDTLGGTLVAPPTQGEIIPLMRNMSALDRAGCRQMALPPQGKMVFPRQSSASTAYWFGPENVPVTASTIGTGQMALEAKKLGVAFIIPNDLFKFSSGAADALIRSDGAKSLALAMDFAGFYGTGAGQPKGLSLYTGTNELVLYQGLTPAPKGVLPNGNKVSPEDAEYMLGAIEDRNFDTDQGFKFIMRGSMFRRLNANRADAVAAGDEAGPFATNLTRLLAAAQGSNWSGMPVIRSAQIKGTLTKGTGTNLSEIYGGMWNECIMAMYGAIEFASSPGENAFLADQTIVRGILYGDIGYRYPGAYVQYTSLLSRYSSATS